MILVDTSVWIELLKPGAAPKIAEEELFSLATCGPVVQELLQGLRDDPASELFRSTLLGLPVLADPVPMATFLSAAAIYRLGRSKGYTIRSSIDCLIAAIAINNGVPVWHRDRDYDAISRFTSLRVRRWPAGHVQ